VPGKSPAKVYPEIFDIFLLGGVAHSLYGPGARFSSLCITIFIKTIMVYSDLNRTVYHKIILGSTARPARKTDKPTAISEPIVASKPYRPSWPVREIALLFLLNNNLSYVHLTLFKNSTYNFRERGVVSIAPRCLAIVICVYLDTPDDGLRT
jgi:hypothetical protein